MKEKEINLVKDLVLSYNKEIEKIEEYLSELRILKDLKTPLELESILGLVEGKVYILHLLEYRDDSIHCFQIERKIKGVFNKLYLQNKNSYNKEVFFYPQLFSILSSGKTSKKPIPYSQFSSWRLLDETGNVILEKKLKSNIVKGTYTKKQIKEIKSRYLYIEDK